MLYGNIIFIKKTGGDGSKFPVTEKIIKIGKSEECLIRIYNSQVAPEHCHLIIEENGQAILRNLSNQTILNGKPLSNKDMVLCHGDIFKLGERLARWEYLPTSKYYRQILSPTGRLVAVVMPQQRPLGEQATPRASVSQGNVSKNTPLGKRRYSDLATAEASPIIKMRKSSGSELVHKKKSNLSKLLIGRHSLKSSKLMVQGGKPKERKSTLGLISSKTPKGQVGGKLRKSTLPLWKVNIVSPPGRTSPSGRSSLKRESVKSRNSVKSSKDKINAESSDIYLSTSKSKIKTPQIDLSSKSSEENHTSTSESALKTPLKTIEESPSRSSRSSRRSQLMLKKSPKTTPLKSPSNIVSSTPQSKFPKSARLIHSESKISSVFEKRSSLPRGSKRKTLMFEKVNFTTPKKSLIKPSPVKVEHEDSQIKTLEVVSDKILQTRLSNNLINKTSVTRKTSPRVSVKNTPVPKTSRKSKETKSKSSTKKTPKNATVFTPVSVTEKQSRTPRNSVSKKLNCIASEGNTALVNLDNISSPENSFHEFSSPKNTPLKKMPAKSVKKIKKTQTPSSSRKTSLSRNETRLSSISSSTEETSGLSPVRFSQRKSKLSLKKIEAAEGKLSSTSKGTTTSRGIQRKLSPSSSAEIAAKKLKTSSPKKPDKNKKAALLVLGKANRKHIISQNVKVLLKQKIVKKALKQSGAVSGHKDESRKKAPSKVKKESQKKTKAGVKKSKSKNVNKSNKKGPSPSKTLKTSDIAPAISFSAANVNQEDTAKDIKVLEESQLNASKVLQTPLRFSSKSKPVEAIPESLSKEKKKSESSFKVDNKTISPSSSFEKNAENYLLNSLRRSSKRLSSKNDTGRPDFIELSPTALGLMPKNLEILKTPKEHKRRSSSLVTPKNVRTSGIIKSASTSKIVNRKSVRFSPKNMSYNSEFSSPNFSDKTEFDFSSFHTPNITMDVFISPLSEKSNVLKKGINESNIFVEEEISKSPNINSKSNMQPKLCIRRYRQSKKSLDISLCNQKMYSGSSKSPEKVSRENKSSENNLSDLEGVQQLFETPKNSLSDLRGVSKLLRTPKAIKSPKNELINLTGVKEVLRTPKMRKSPRNDLTDVRGVKKLLQTPKAQKSPKNDLTDVRGVKKLLQTPKLQKSPKNDLTDVRGVKKLLRTPKAQKNPRNDLTDVRGVKKLLQTPKTQKSPKNDLTDVRGVKKLLQTPKFQKSPKNDLTDVRGVKKLLGTPKVQKSPRNDLTDVRGVKKLLQTPKTQKSPKNDLTDVRGVKKLLQTPKVQKSPKNELSDLRGVKRLLGSPKLQKSPKNNLLEFSGMGDLFKSPTKQDLSENSALQSEESLSKNLTNITEKKQLLISKTPENISKDKKTVSRKSRVKDFKAIRGRRTIYSSPKAPKNDLSDLMGVRELFIRHKPTSDYNVDLTGVAEIFDVSEYEADCKLIAAESVEKSPLKVSGIKSLRRRKLTEIPEEKREDVKATTRGTRLKKAAMGETEEEASKKSKVKVADSKERKPIKRKAVEKVKTVSAKKTYVGMKKSEQTTEKSGEKVRTRMKVNFGDDNLEVKSTRKRKTVETLELSPPKLRRKLRGAEESSSSEAKDTPRKSRSRSKSKAGSEEEVSAEKVQKVSAEVKGKKKPEVSPKVQTKKAIKTSGTKQTQKVQSKRSQSKSKNVSGSVSPRKTRSARAKTSTEKVSVGKKTSAETVGKTAGMKKLSPAVKRSTRRKVK